MKLLRFLLVEDSLLDAELAHAHLLENGIECELIRVETREAFVAALRNDTFDLILADYTLPTFDGLAALAIARDLCPDLPFIFVSGHLGEEIAIEALKSGATDYVLKQRLLRLASSVKRALREAQEHLELKQAEQSLQRAHQTLTFHTENSPLGVVEWDQDFRVVSWSQQAEVIFGWTAAEVMGKHPTEWQFILEEDISFVQNTIKSLTTGHQQRNVSSNRNYTKDGRIIYCEWYNSGLIDEHGNLLSVLSRVQDVTDRIYAEAEIRRREQQFRTLAENSPDIILRVDLQLRHLYISPAIERITGVPAEVFIGRTASEVGLTRFLYEGWEAKVRTVIATGKAENWEFDFFSPTGKLYFQMRLVPEYSFDGEVESVLCISTDVTNYKRSEQALRKSEARFRYIFESEMIGMGFWDNQGNITEVNNAFLDLVGYSREDILTGQVTWRDVTPSEDVDVELDKQRELNELGCCSPYEKEYIRPDGSRVFALLGAAKFESPLEGGVFFALDVTEIKQLEKKLLQQTEELSRANRVKDEFLAVLSHELRSPLNAMLGWAQLLRSRKFDESTIARALETIERNAKLQGQLIEDLLDISRIIRGKLNLNISSVNLITPIRAAIDTMRLAAEAKSLKIYTSIDPKIGLISGDPSRLQQVVWNLLSNAIKFTPEGGSVEIVLSKVKNTQAGKVPDSRTSYAQILVRDTGKGINSEFLPHVFDYFRQADSSITRAQGGLGLGLAIVRHLVELHGGVITAESAGEGKGATFTVTLPLLPAPEEITTPQGDFDEEMCLQDLRVLVVDDELDTREFLIFMLQQFGAEVTGVGSASEAMDVLPSFKPNVLVSDVGMPYEDGYTLIRKLRNLDLSEGSQTPAIALTAYARTEDRQLALEAGFQIHVAKPVNPVELAQAVAGLCGRHVRN